MTLRLIELARLTRGEVFVRLFSEIELQRECRWFMPYTDIDLAQGLLHMWLVGLVYPLVLPRRWIANGRMIGVRLNCELREGDILFRASKPATNSSHLELTRAQFGLEKIELATSQVSLSVMTSGAVVSNVVPIGNEYSDPSHIGNAIGKF